MKRVKKKSDVLKPADDLPPVMPLTSGMDVTDKTISQQTATGHNELRVLQALRQVIRAVDLHSRWLLSQHKITGPQLITLLTIEREEPVTASAIASHIHLSPSTVIGILDRLEAKGLIRRDRDLRDRRMIWISLTERGKFHAYNSPSPIQDTLAEAIAKLPESESVIILESLERIVELMQMHHLETESAADI